MGRRSDEPELLGVRVLEDLGMPVADVERLGFRVGLHWSNVAAVSERDAFALVKRREVAAEQANEQHEVMIRGQREWLAGRNSAYRTEYQRVAGPHSTPQESADARSAGIRAMIAYEAANDPEQWGFPSSIRTDPAAGEQLVSGSSWSTVGEVVH